MATLISPSSVGAPDRDFKADAQTAVRLSKLGAQILAGADDASLRVMRNPQTGRQMAVKRSQLNKTTSYGELEQEILGLLNLQHPCVTRLTEVYIHGSQLYQVFEYATGGSLMSFVDKRLLSEAQCRYLFQQLAAAVDFCHSQGAPGRDLKLENILLTKTTPPEVKLADPAITKHSSFADIGCPGSIYAAPELLKARNVKGSSTPDGHAADVWSLGVILAAILFHAYPFADPEQPKNITKIFENILAGRYFMPDNVALSSDCKDLLARIFVVDPTQRITMRELRQHPWVVRDLPKKLAMPYRPLDNPFLETQAERVIETLRSKRAGHLRQAMSYIV